MSFKICMFAIMCASLGAVIKHILPGFSPFFRIAASVIVVAFAMTVISPLLLYLKSLLSEGTLGKYGDMLVKAIGIAFVVQISSDICRDCGEGSIASGVEFMGRLEILLLCLPMFQEVIETVGEVMSWA